MEIKFDVSVYESDYTRDRYEMRGESSITINVDGDLAGKIVNSPAIFEALLQTAIARHMEKIAKRDAGKSAAEPEEEAAS